MPMLRSLGLICVSSPINFSYKKNPCKNFQKLIKKKKKNQVLPKHILSLINTN